MRIRGGIFKRDASGLRKFVPLPTAFCVANSTITEKKAGNQYGWFPAFFT
ncbi:hypothetical protein [Bacillus sp. FJAT-27445]|nr:hypothetical protein [Bacillus sp. FJAT-27445]